MTTMGASDQMVNSLSMPATQVHSIKEDKVAQRMLELFFLLSRPDAIRIFSLAREGLRSKRDTPSEIGLTKKQYYTRLRQLGRFELGGKKGIYNRKKNALSVSIYHNPFWKSSIPKMHT